MWNRPGGSGSLMGMTGDPRPSLRERLRSPAAENRFGVVLVLIPPAFFVFLVTAITPAVDWSVAWPSFASCVALVLAASGGLAALFTRWRPRSLRDMRDANRTMHWAVPGFFLGFCLCAPLVVAATFAEDWVCARGEGVVVTTSWTGTVDGDTRTGVYTVDGETYDLVAPGAQYLTRQVTEPVQPSADNEYYTRTYRVPWVGSSSLCATPQSSDLNEAAGLVIGGTLFTVPAWLALFWLLRRRRTDESPLAAKSHPA